MAFLQFLITTTGAAGNVSLPDLGDRTFPNSLTNYDLSQEFTIEEIRYSKSLADAIYTNGWTATDSLGQSITAQASLALTETLLNKAGHAQTSDALPQGSSNLYATDGNIQTSLGNLSIDDLGDVDLSGIVAGQTLIYGGSPGMFTASNLVTSVNTYTGVVTLDTDDIGEGTTNLYFTNTRARNAISIEAGSSQFLEYNSGTGEIGVKALALTDVSVDATYTSLGEWISAVYTGSPLPFQEGDVIILTAATGGTQTYINNGTNGGTAADWTIIESPQLSDSYIRGLFSGVAPISYNNSNGQISLSLKANGGLVIESNELAIDLGATNITGTLAVEDGGTGATTLTSGQVLLGNGTSAITSVARGNATAGSSKITIGGTGTSAVLGTGFSIDVNESNLSLANIGGLLSLTTQVTEILPVANGGTGLNGSTAANGTLLIGNGTGYTLATLSQGDDITITNGAGSITVGITNSSVGEGKLDATNTPTDGQYLSYAGSDQFTWVTNAASKKTWSWGASSSAANTTNRFLDRHDGTPTNESPYVTWFASTLKSISLSSNAASTWTAEVYVNGVSAATLASGGSQYAQVTGLSVAIAAGDRVSFYVNGTGVNKPSIDVLIEEA